MFVRTLFILAAIGNTANAHVLPFDSGYKEIATYLAQGSLVWDRDNSWTYNGQPTSQTNYPSAYELELSSTITLFTSTPSKTLGGTFPFGQPFSYSGD
jgi:hypothetical protein